MNFFKLILIVFLFYACEDKLGEKSSIVGTWEWVNTINYAPFNAPYILTPESEGYTRTWIFFEIGSVEKYRGDSLEIRTDYKLDTQKWSNGTESDTMLFFKYSGNWTGGHEFWVLPDTLFVSTSYVDGPAELFKRRIK